MPAPVLGWGSITLLGSHTLLPAAAGSETLWGQKVGKHPWMARSWKEQDGAPPCFIKLWKALVRGKLSRRRSLLGPGHILWATRSWRQRPPAASLLWLRLLGWKLSPPAGPSFP